MDRKSNSKIVPFAQESLKETKGRFYCPWNRLTLEIKSERRLFMKIINKLPKYLLFVQGIPYFCMLFEMIELVLESNIFNVRITTNIITTIWCFYCVYCVHIVGIAAVISSIIALIMNFKEKASRKKYIIYTLVHIFAAWFTWLWFNALMSV